MYYDDPDLKDQAIRKALKTHHDQMMKKYGWYAHYVPDDPTSPTEFNAHTHGFEESWGHPDVQIVFPLPQGVAHSIFWNVVHAIKKGKPFRFSAGKPYADIIEKYNVTFAWAKEGGRRVLRIILPDEKGVFARGLIEEPYSIQWEGTE